ncbi:MAG: TonB-dependent receptor plug domain-containing protein [Chakrabartia sp.]
MQLLSFSMSPRSQIAAGVATGVMAIALLAGPAAAQPTQDPPSGDVSAQADGSPAQPQGSEIIVTGSRIARPELEANVPIAAVTSEALQEDAAINVQDTLAELPQVGIGSTRTNSNFLTGANGVATVNLRNLGSSRTLVLVNGRRFVSGLAGSSAVDINNIPTDFIDRVDIVTGGASAIYGSEAISGVVNFILKDKFEGIQARGQYGITERGDNPRYMGSLTAGQSFMDGRANILANFTYDKDAGLFSRKRDISDQDCFLNASPDECGPAFYSSYAAQGRFELLDANGARANVLNGQGLFTFDPDNALVEGFPVGSGFNRNAARRISVPLERYLGSALVNFEVVDGVTLYAEGTYGRVKSSSQIEATPLDYTDIYDGSAGNLGIPITNPFIPADVAAAIAAANSDADPTNDVAALGFRRRQVEVFSRSNRADRETWRVAAGIRGNVMNDFRYDVSYVYGHLRDNTSSEDIDNARYRQALNAIVDPTTGAIVCADPAARAAGCVPINLFGYNTASPEASAYVRSAIPKSEEVTNTQHVVSANLSGDLMELPGGKLAIAVGAEYRRESSVDDLDDLTNTGGNSGNLIPDTRGKFHVWEAYGEVNVPLISEKPMFHYLGLTGAARYSDYSTIGNVFSWNAGAEWAPFDGLRLRGVYAVANRAPNIGELFSAPAETFPTVTDPCIGVSASAYNSSTTTAAQAAACRALPGYAANVGASTNGAFFYDLADIQGINGFDGGNTNLQEETARTITLGGVLTPRAIPGFALSVDYFHIKVKDAIGTVPRDVSIGQCLETGDAAFCNNVLRDPNTGRLLTVNSQLANIADLKTSGIDVALRYNRALGLVADDRLDLNVYYTYLISLEKRAFAGAPLEENRGQLSGDGRLGAGFKHKASARIGYSVKNVTLSWQVNYLGKIQDTLGGYGDDGLDRLNTVGDAFYHDVQARFRAGQDERFEFYVGVDNLFDRAPPFLPSGFASDVTGTETAADTYDPFGRRYYAGARVRF